jgi:hypothetical protein
MNRTFIYLCSSALVWSLFILTGIILINQVGPFRNSDVYNIQGGLRALNEQPLLIIGGQIVFAWAGLAFLCMVILFYDWMRSEQNSSNLRIATVSGLISTTLFLFYGIVGAFTSFDMNYLQSVRGTAYVQEAYLPVTLIMNRIYASSITLSGIWFTVINWQLNGRHILPRFVPYLGIGAGILALPGFVLPGGGFSLLSLLLSALWGISMERMGFRSWRDSEANPESMLQQ